MQTSPVVKVLAAWLLVLMLVGAAFVATVSLLNSRLYGPEHQVGLYLEALRDGEGGKALGLLDAAVPDGSDPSLLDGDALRTASAALGDAEIGDARERGTDHVEVPVTYPLDGAETTSVFALERTGTEWGLFTTWHFEQAALPTVEVSSPTGVKAAVNGGDVGLPDGRARLAAFYPGAVTAGYAGRYVTAPEQHTTVTGPGESQRVALVTEATPALADAAEEQLHTFLDDCAKQTVFQPTDCPFAYVTDKRLAGDIAWSIEEYPEVAVTRSEAVWRLEPLRGKARIHTKLRDMFSGEVRDVTETVPFDFTADLTVTEDAVTVIPSMRY